MKARVLRATCGLTALLTVVVIPTADAAPPDVSNGVRRELLQWPYYGVFDFISGTHCCRGTRQARVRAQARRVAGFSRVNNELMVDYSRSPLGDPGPWAAWWGDVVLTVRLPATRRPLS